MAFSEQDIEDWVGLTRFLAQKGAASFRSMLYEHTHAQANNRASLWRALVAQGVSQTQIALAFNVTQQAVSKAIRRKQSR